MTTSEAVQGGVGGLVIERRNALGLLTVTRPEKRNALTIAMRRAIGDTMPRLARDPIIYAAVVRSGAAGIFSSGGDVVEMTTLAESDHAAAVGALADELRLVWLMECFSKPTIALIDGVVMGGGNGVSLYGTHRVAGEGYRFAMPETRIGLFPNNGLAHRFARMPGEIGVYLALTGATIGPADAYHLGLATHCIAAEHFDQIIARLSDADPVDPLLDGLHREPGPAHLQAHAGVIARCFGAGTVAEILARLEAERGPDAEFARATRDELLACSPVALVLTHRLLREASALDLKGVLELEHRLITRIMELPDIHEGVRAWRAGRGAAPSWRPAQVENVGRGMIDALFAPADERHLSLKPRAEMQAIKL